MPTHFFIKIALKKWQKDPVHKSAEDGQVLKKSGKLCSFVKWPVSGIKIISMINAVFRIEK